MRADELARLRPRLVDFTAQMLQGAVRRSDQQVNGELYVRGLLTDGARKSMRPMAQRLGVDHQRLQQFVTSSTWELRGGPGEHRPMGGRGDRPAGVGGG